MAPEVSVGTMKAAGSMVGDVINECVFCGGGEISVLCQGSALCGDMSNVPLNFLSKMIISCH